MKKSEIISTTLLVPIDFLMLVLAGLAAYFLRVSPFVREIRPVMFELELPFSRYVPLVIGMSLLWMLIFALAGLYRVKRRKFFEEFFQIVVATSLGIMAIIIYIFIGREWFNSRFIILAAWAFAIIFVTCGRLFLKIVQDLLVSKYDLGAYKVLVVGADRLSEEIIREIDSRPALGLRVFKQIPDLNMKTIKAAVQNPRVEEIILSSLDYPRERILELMDFCEEKRLTFKFAPNLLQTITQNTAVDTLGGVPIIELKRTALDGWGKIAKRLTDIVGASLCIIFFLPLKSAIAIAIKLDSPGPVIYKNRRRGPDGEFDTYKFRTMKMKYCTGPGYEKDGSASAFEDGLIKKYSQRNGPVFKILNDPRRTRMGRFLERTSLDELPQFFNVLRGEMSLVGPRPHMPKEVAKYEKHHKKVFNIKPGVTGLAQVSGRSDLDFEDEVKLDTYYIENWSIWLDFIVMLKTPFVALFRRHRQ